MAAAPQAPGRGSVRRTRPLPVKTSLTNPYTICWSALDGEDMRFILQTLEDRFQSLGLRKIEDKRRKKKQFLKKQSPDQCSAEVENSSEDPKEKPPEGSEQGSGWTPADVRKQLAIGVNEVTRALERDGLQLVLVCKSAKPARITSHLIQLSLSRSVPACQVPRLSERLAPVIGLKCVLALGFTKTTTAFVAEVRAIIPRVPGLHVPWLQGRPEDSGENLDTASSESQDGEILETSLEDLSKHKRKLVGGRQAVVLQPLKIKKLIPNPNKIRKPPKGKKTTSK